MAIKDNTSKHLNKSIDPVIALRDRQADGNAKAFTFHRAASEVAKAKHGQHICGAPWSSLIFEASSEIAFCCMANSTAGVRDLRQGTSTVTDTQNSVRAKAVRANFLNGTYQARLEQFKNGIFESELDPDGDYTEEELALTYCDSCWRNEATFGVISEPRQFGIEQAVHVLDDAIAQTDPDGYIHKQTPTWIDTMFSNKCNFACMGCHPTVSSPISKYLEAYDIRDLQSMPRQSTPTEVVISNSDPEGVIDYVIEHRDTINMIHLQGGEPFMMPEVYLALDKLIQHDLHKPDGISIWCHTNGAIRTYKGIDIIEKYLAKWENRFRITISHDGYGPRGEYIRYGYTDKKWLETFHRIHDSGASMHIQHSLNIFNILHQYDCLNWYLEQLPNLDSEGNTVSETLSFGYWSGLFGIDNIQLVPELHERAMASIQACIGVIDYTNEYTKLLARLERMSSLNIEFHKYFNKAVSKFDELRGTDFHKTFPELKPLWDYYNDQMR